MNNNLFESMIDRKNTNSKKWDIEGDGLIPFSIADMDFLAPNEIVEAVSNRAAHGIYGYTYRSRDYYNSIVNWVYSQYNWKIKRDEICHSPGIVTGLSLVLESLTIPGDSIMIQTPVYYPFMKVINLNNRNIVYNHLINDKYHYEIDFEDFENKIKESKIKLFFLCNPHNPVGRVWTKKELIKLGEICVKHNVIIVSDEVHSDIIFAGNQHQCFASISEAFANQSITCIAPSKTFNLAGLQTSAIIIPNEKLRNKYMNTLSRLSLDKVSPFGVVALEAAYRHGYDWLKGLLDYLQGNLSFIETYLKTNLPELKYSKPEGTYLLWIDCRELNLSNEELESFMLEKVKINVRQGYQFGPGGDGFIRLNFACPRSMLKQGLSQLKDAINQMEKTYSIT